MNDDLLATLNISDELKAKAMAATSPRELMELAIDAGVELTDAQLEGIAGGGDWMSCDEVSQAGDTRDDIDEELVSEAFKSGADLGDDAE